VSTTAELIAFVRGLEPGGLADDTVQQAKRCVLDLLGVALAGCRTPMAEASARFGFAHFGSGQATVLGFPTASSPIGATWVNGISASALDLDDGHRAAMGHPGASVIPAALAIAEAVGASGKAFLAAVVAGYEVAVRVSVSRRPPYKERLYSTGIWGGLGAATAAAKLLQLDARAMEHTLGIAFAHGPFPGSGVDSRMVKEGIGWAGMAGCAAALMAQQGFEGPGDAFGQYGRHDPGELVRDLGKDLAIDQVYFKPHASCRWSHPAVDGILELVRRDHIRPEEVEAVAVEGFYETTRLSKTEPATTVAAQFSIPFCVAIALTYGRVGPAEVSEANLHNPQVLGLARKVSIAIDPDLDREFPAKTMTRVTAQTRHGEFTELIEYPKGNVENPLTEAEHLTKFQSLAADILGAGRVAALKEAVEQLDRMSDIRDFTRLLVVGP
jgi:2-methylcitrate dehydratase PrpD